MGTPDYIAPEVFKQNGYPRLIFKPKKPKKKKKRKKERKPEGEEEFEGGT